MSAAMPDGLRSGRCIRSILAAWLVVLASPALGATIGFSPPVAVASGAEAEVDLVISDLSGEIVSGYELDVLYDAGALTVLDVDFGLSLGDPVLFEVLESFDLSSPGTIGMKAVSLLSDVELAPLQGDSVVLATLRFGILGLGDSGLGIDATSGANQVVGAGGELLDVTTDTGVVSAVPEPGAASLFGIGLAITAAGLRAARRIE